MYLHLGAETVVRTDSIVAVCDLDNASSSHITREDGKTRIYLSQLNTATLLKRAENISFD